jgi:hypothetical protein
VLDQHGYGFQYAVLNKCRELFDRDQDSPWSLEVAELPVETKDSSTHVDFVLLLWLIHQESTSSSATAMASFSPM